MNDMFLNRLNNNHIPSLTGRGTRGYNSLSTNILSLTGQVRGVRQFIRALPYANDFGLSAHCKVDANRNINRLASVNKDNYITT
jgi:hypothetical protein